MSHLEKESELNGLEAPGELELNTVTQDTTKQIPEKPKLICHNCEKPNHYQNQAINSERTKTKPKETKIVLTKVITVVMKNLTVKTLITPILAKKTVQLTERTEN